MPTLEQATAWSAASIIGASLVWRTLSFASREQYLPPGPPTIPVLGNAHLLPTKKAYKQLKEWSDEYGPVFSLKLGQMTMIVLNSRRAVYELMDKKGLLAADRPRDEHMELAFGGEVITVMHSNDLWKAERKMTEHLLSPRRLDGELVRIQDAEITYLMKQLLDQPEGFFDHIRRTSASTGSILYFGQRAEKWDGFWAQAGFKVMREGSKNMELGTYIPTDAFPILGVLPDWMYTTKKRARKTFGLLTETWAKARRIVDERRERGDIRDSIIDKILDGEVISEVPLSDRVLNNYVGSLQMATADTIGHTLLTHVMYLAKHPHVQEKARKELDRVCGTERLPRWTDFDQLPYINAIVKEGQRVHPNVPITPPHTVTGDHWYDGMLIPDGATILIPTWALHYSGCDDPSVYNPDQFLKYTRTAPDYASSNDYENRDHYAYGYGRRICGGMHLAERIQWRMIAFMLWAFELREVGEIDVDAFSDGLLHAPHPFKVDFTPRSARHAEIVRREFEQVEELLKMYD